MVTQTTWLGCFCLNTQFTRREMHSTLALHAPTQNSVHLCTHIATVVGHIIIVTFNIDKHNTCSGTHDYCVYKQQNLVLHEFFTYINTCIYKEYNYWEIWTVYNIKQQCLTCLKTIHHKMHVLRNILVCLQQHKLTQHAKETENLVKQEIICCPGSWYHLISAYAHISCLILMSCIDTQTYPLIKHLSLPILHNFINSKIVLEKFYKIMYRAKIKWVTEFIMDIYSSTNKKHKIY